MKDYKKNKLHLTNDQMTDSVALVWPNQSMRIKHYSHLEDLYSKLLVNLLKNKIKVFLFSNGSCSIKVDQIRKGHNGKYINHFKFNSDDIWLRDYCPIQAFNPINNNNIFLSYSYNAYGEKYVYGNDKHFANFFLSSINKPEAIDMCNKNIILEGGNIVNNENICLVNINCLRHHNQQQDYQVIKNQLELFFEKNIYQQLDFIDVPSITGDDTNGHIDNLVRFYDDAILLMSTNSKHHPDYEKLKKLEKQIYAICERYDMKNVIHVKHDPQNITKNERDEILPFSYLNYLKVDDIVYMPLVGSETDEEKSYLREIFYKDDLVFIYSKPLLSELGGLHCCSYNWRYCE
tara:strand:- start:571 stop:1611 length:1041 start_codon:yes stop_codon:yes gene_type:complete